LGAEILNQLGYEAVGRIVAEHVRLNDGLANTRVATETELINYSDKRVLHDTIVSLGERFEDLKIRYGRKDQDRERIEALYRFTLTLEKKIFQNLPFTPEEIVGAI
jgi:hypothetical protein